MTRKKFIKQLMAAGVSRNTAAEAASTAPWTGQALGKTLGHLLTIRDFMAWNGSKQLVADFEREILRAARIVKMGPAPWQRIRPLASRKKHRARHDGYRAMYYFIDEMAEYRPQQGGAGNA